MPEFQNDTSCFSFFSVGHPPHLFKTPLGGLLANSTHSCVSICARVYINVCVRACLFACFTASAYASVIPTSRQVDKSEDVILDEAGETQEDGVEEETREP